MIHICMELEFICIQVNGRLNMHLDYEKTPFNWINNDD